MKIKSLLLAFLLSSSGVIAQNQITIGGTRFITSKAGDYTNSTTTANTQNIFIGLNGGGAASNFSGKWNTALGEGAGRDLTSGTDGTFVGFKSGISNTSGSFNTAIGSFAGINNKTGSSNTYIGKEAGYVIVNTDTDPRNGSYNTALGYQAGRQNVGQGNVFLGYKAGYYTNNSAGSGTAASNNFVLSNRDMGSVPLMLGKFESTTPSTTSSSLVIFGKTAITLNTGVTQNAPSFTFPANAQAGNALFVDGGILARQITVATLASDWADYVFKDGYKLKSLSEVDSYIKENGHLPNVPSAEDIETNGANLGELTRIQQEKIEELTLYAIEQEKQMNEQAKRLDEQAIQLKAQQKELDQIKQILTTRVSTEK